MIIVEGKKKVPEGKLVRVKAKIEDDIIYDISLWGDFFLEPTDGLEKLQECFKGCGLDEVNKIKRRVDNKSLSLIGFSVETVIEILEENI